MRNTIKQAVKSLLGDRTVNVIKRTAKTEPDAFHLHRQFPLTGTTPCPACAKTMVTHKSDYPSLVNPFAQQTVLYCTACGLGYVPRAKPMLDQYYARDYAADNRGDRKIDPQIYFSDAHRTSSKTMTRYFTRANSQTALLKKHGAVFERVLDFGSGPGYFLHVSNAAQKFAFEPDLESRKYLDYLDAKQYTDLSDIPTQYFDVITASHTIEHLPAEDLHSTIRTLLAALKPTGRMLIEVPQGGHSYLHLRGARQDPHTLFFTPQAIVEAVHFAGGNIFFQGAVGKPQIPTRENPIYAPDPKNTFFSVPRGGLTVVCGPKP